MNNNDNPEINVSLPTPSNAARGELSKLLAFYSEGRYCEAESLALSIIINHPDQPFSWKVLGAIYAKTDRLDNALDANRKAVKIASDDPDAHYNLGNALRKSGRFEESESSYNEAIALKSDFASAHYNLGLTLYELGRLEEAEASYKQALVFKPDHYGAHNNLGHTLRDLERLEDAEAIFKQAIALKPDIAEAHHNLGLIFTRLGKLDEAEISFGRAIFFKPDFSQAHKELGVALRRQNKISEALKSLRQAIAINPDFADGYTELAVVQYRFGNINAARVNLLRSRSIDSESKKNNLFLNILNSRLKSSDPAFLEVGISKHDKVSGCASLYPVTLSRAVDADLIKCLYELNTINLDAGADPSFGNSAGDWGLFSRPLPLIQAVEKDLVRLMREAVKNDVFVWDSFFSIFGAGGGTLRHNHLLPGFDDDPSFGLVNRKFSLVYYLSVGDQNCPVPGYINFYDPAIAILPSDGMVMIFPADKYHSSNYNGNRDRVIIGANFYAI